MAHSSLNISVFGAGSIGCYVGGQLAYAGARVRLIGRERFRKLIADHGLTLTHYERETFHVPATDITFDLNAENARDADIVLVTVKSQDTEAAGHELAKILKPDTVVISLQNGVGNAQTLRRAMPDFQVLGAMVPFNVTSTGPAQFHSGTEGDLYFQNTDMASLRQMQTCFQDAKQGCTLVDDIIAVQWGKLLINLNNAMNTLAGAPLKQCLVQKPYRLALALMIEEALTVVKASGVAPAPINGNAPEKMIKVLRLPNFLYSLIMNMILKIDASARSSMLDDLEAGRMSEVAYLQGEIVKLAESLGITAPINAKIMALVQDAFEQGQSPCLSGGDILSAIKG